MNRIKAVIEEKGIKQTWLAEKLGKSYNMMNSYVQNRRQPRLDDLYKIAEILGVEARELLILQDDQIIIDDNNDGDVTKVPVVGKVSCGLPIYAEENINTYISISKEIAKPQNDYFILYAEGDSMNLAGINSGDMVLIKQQPSANDGDLVVALIDDEATIKVFHKKNNMIILKPKSDNKQHQPIILTSNFRIQGVVADIIPM